MEHRTQKQLIITTIFFFLLFSFFGGSYFAFFKKAPTCFDRVQNQGEKNTDCGGPCIPCEELSLQKPEIIWVKIFKVEKGMYDIGASIKNINTNYGSARIPYTFIIYGRNNEVLMEKSGKGFILPREEKYILEPGLRIPDIPKSVSLEFGKTEWSRFESLDTPDLSTYGIAYNILPPEKKDIGFSEVVGNFINKTPYDLDKVIINVVLYNAPLGENGTPIAMNRRIENTVLSGQDRAFKMHWPAPFFGNTRGIDVRVETNAFLNENFLRITR